MPAPKGNLYALGNSGGRPPIYETADEIRARIEEYLAYCEGEYETQTITEKRKRKDPETGKMVLVDIDTEIEVCIRQPERPMITGLTLFLGFESRQSLHDYAKKEEFSYPIKRVLTLIEKGYEELLPFAKGPGVIFALKNMGWEDKSTVDNKHEFKEKPDFLKANLFETDEGEE